MPDFWPNCGFHLLEHDGDGHLAITDDYLRAYFRRPELAPVEESCEDERALHRRLLDDPRVPVPDGEIAGIADGDARDNYRVVLDLRDRLLAAGTVEGCYRALYRDSRVTLPALFLDQMVHVILRNILDGTPHPLRARAAELFFREQTAMIQDGAILLGDSGTVEMLSAPYGDLGRLVAEAGTPLKRVEMDVLGDDNGDIYWGRDERHDTAFDLTFPRPGLDAFCRVLESWISHFLEARVRVQPVQKISDEHWAWHLGLDAEGSALLNDLYDGAEVAEERLERLLNLFRLDFDDESLMRADVAGRPVYLGLAMTAENKVRMKPQNLLVNLPLARGS